MARGFSVTETIDRPAAEVWAYLVDFDHASEWMHGVDDMIQLTPGAIDVGTGFNFNARGKMHQTEITAFNDQEADKLIALTSKQGGVAATYSYQVSPLGDDQTALKLDVVCKSSGLWVLISPLIVWAIKRADSGQLAHLKEAILKDSSG